MRSMKKATTGIAVLLFWPVLLSHGLNAAEQAPQCDYEKMFGREDGTIFGRDCAICHSMGGPWDKPGGALNGLFLRDTLMFTGEPVTEESVRNYIAEGGPRMPGFKYTLTEEQIDDLVQYLKTAHCPQDLSLEKERDKYYKAKKSSSAGIQ